MSLSSLPNAATHHSTTEPRIAGSLQPTGISERFLLFSPSFFDNSLRELVCVGMVTWQHGFPAKWQRRSGCGKGSGSCERPKKRDWDPHGQEKQSKISFFLARQVGWAEAAHL